METPDRLDRWIPRLMVLVILGIAIFAFTQSYTHIYFLGKTHHQDGASLRMLPLSVDLLMVGAGLVMLHLRRKGIEHPLPRGTLWGAAGVTLLANVASGIIWGWESAVISAWAPIALFVAVELGMLVVRTAKQAKPELSLEPRDPGKTINQLRAEAGMMPIPTELRQPQATPEPSPDTATMPEAVDGSPRESLAGWGQLGRPDTGGLSGIGLSNGRK
jgi:hypothetical protein